MSVRTSGVRKRYALNYFLFYLLFIFYSFFSFPNRVRASKKNISLLIKRHVSKTKLYIHLTTHSVSQSLTCYAEREGKINKLFLYLTSAVLIYFSNLILDCINLCTFGCNHFVQIYYFNFLKFKLFFCLFWF